MKERGSDREKGSAKSCQPEIKQAGTLPIPEPLHPPQSHILPLHSLYLSATASIFRLSRLLCPFHGKEIYLKAWLPSTLALCSCRTHRHTCVIRHASDQTCTSTQRRGSQDAAAPVWSRVYAAPLFVCLPAALQGKLCNSGNNTHRCFGRKKTVGIGGSFLQKNSAYLVKGHCVCGSAGRKYSWVNYCNGLKLISLSGNNLSRLKSKGAWETREPAY